MRDFLFVVITLCSHVSRKYICRQADNSPSQEDNDDTNKCIGDDLFPFLYLFLFSTCSEDQKTTIDQEDDSDNGDETQHTYNKLLNSINWIVTTVTFYITIYNLSSKINVSKA